MQTECITCMYLYSMYIFITGIFIFGTYRLLPLIIILMYYFRLFYGCSEPAYTGTNFWRGINIYALIKIKMRYDIIAI